MSAEKTIGTVKWYNTEKGFGFISCEGDEQDVFLHRIAVEKAGIDTPNTGDQLRFFVKTRDDGKRAARHVERMDQPSNNTE